MVEASSISSETVELFTDLAQGKSWDELKLELVQQSRPEDRLKCLNQMQELVRVRDLIDYMIYREAALRVFPSTHFTVIPRASGKAITTSDGHSKIVDKWYTLEVMNISGPPAVGVQPGKCTIKVHAPGSRKVTSDIDTSIQTTISGNFSATGAKGTPGVPQIAGVSVAKRISHAMIDEFYHLSEDVFGGMTSSTHRDSNAYIDVLTNDAEEYPKFKYEDYNPLVGGVRLFTDEAFTKTFLECKRQKHIQEQAASLFSLRLSLEDKEWIQFKEKVREQWQTIFAAFDVKPTQVQEDWKAIFDRVEELHTTYLKTLGDSHGEDRIKVMNQQYILQLEKCAALDEKILKAEQEKKELIEKLEAKFNARTKAQNVLKDLSSSSEDPDIKDLAEQKKLVFAKLDGEYVELLNKLMSCLQNLATTRLDKQLELIRATTFANEAYICRSAVYHVVNAQKGAKFSLEKGAEFRMTEQTFLGSALQQIGFKLLHSHELREKGKTPGEVAYLTAKYGQRVFNLIFNQQMTNDGKPLPVPDAGLESLATKIGTNKFGSFSWLKSETQKNNFYRVLDRDELLVLNYQAKLIAEVKDKDSIKEHEKSGETLKRMLVLAANLKIEGTDEEKIGRFQEKERQLFLSLAAKLIAIVCASKLERQQHLWGYEPEFSPTTSKTKSSIPVESAQKTVPPLMEESVPSPTDAPRFQPSHASATSTIDKVHLQGDAKGAQIIGKGGHGHIGTYIGEGNSLGLNIVGATPELIQAAAGLGRERGAVEKK